MHKIYIEQICDDSFEVIVTHDESSDEVYMTFERFDKQKIILAAKNKLNSYKERYRKTHSASWISLIRRLEKNIRKIQDVEEELRRVSCVYDTVDFNDSYIKAYYTGTMTNNRLLTITELILREGDAKEADNR